VKRNPRIITAPIPEGLHTALSEYADESGIAMSRIVEAAIRAHLIRRLGDDYGPGRMDALCRRMAL
jgi:hypothetical protein